MPHRSRSGFTLIELLIALILLVVVGGSFWSAMAGVQRTTRTQAEVSAMRGTVRSGLQIVASDLQELYTDDGTQGPVPFAESDIYAMNETSISYRGMRGAGVVCEASLTEVKIREEPEWWTGLHAPAQTDSLLIFADGNENDNADDEWLWAGVTAAPNGGQACATGGISTRLIIQFRTQDNTAAKLAKIKFPAPVRTFEIMRLGLVTADGRDWLGFRAPSDGSFVPVVGPLATGGVLFEYFQADGTPTTNTNLVKSIRLTLTGETDRRVNEGVSSSLVVGSEPVSMHVQLRNSR